MKSKFLIFIIITIAIILAVGLSLWLRYQAVPVQGINTANDPVPTAGRIDIIGVVVCLPSAGHTFQDLDGVRSRTSECLLGLKGSDNRYYNLKNLGLENSTTNVKVRVRGDFTPVAERDSDIDPIGSIDVEKIIRAE